MQDQNHLAETVLDLGPEEGVERGAVMSSDVLSILGEGRDATLATLRPDGWPQAAIINYVNDDERLYFDCAVGSQKAHNIAGDDRISLALIVPYPAFGPIYGLSLAGHAKLISDPEDLSHVLDLWEVRYPYMKRRLEQDIHEFAFYAVTPTVVTMPDYRSGLGHRGPSNHGH